MSITKGPPPDVSQMDKTGVPWSIVWVFDRIGQGSRTARWRLYGAFGINHDPVLTKLLRDAGADPNDGKSLYRALENSDRTRLLLRHGACVT